MSGVTLMRLGSVWSLVLLKLLFSCHLSDLQASDLNLDPYLVCVKLLHDIRPLIEAGFLFI